MPSKRSRDGNVERLNVYDVVAGRLSKQRYKDSQDKGTHVRANRTVPAPADDILARYARADEDIPVEFHPDLPNSALHYYVGEYFRHHDNFEGYRTMDETALLALGVVAEETIKDFLGPRGAMLYAERDESDGT